MSIKKVLDADEEKPILAYDRVFDDPEKESKRLRLLNTPRYVKEFELLSEECCDGLPLMRLKLSASAPAITWCPKCLRLVEKEIKR